MQPCDCQTRRDFFNIHPEELRNFLLGFVQLTTDRHADYHLYRCPLCNTLWLVDDTTRSPMAVRVSSEAAAIDFDERPYRRQLMVEWHGGVTDQKCNFIDCNNRALRGIVYCVDHAYPMFAVDNPKKELFPS
ncbi:MAG TPA: hypothetical protein VMG59_12500 [Phycisphaerae bacterium]|nr:hypothetical protein [Phycisphaerae bacterium]